MSGLGTEDGLHPISPLDFDNLNAVLEINIIDVNAAQFRRPQPGIERQGVHKKNNQHHDELLFLIFCVNRVKVIAGLETTRNLLINEWNIF